MAGSGLTCARRTCRLYSIKGSQHHFDTGSLFLDTQFCTYFTHHLHPHIPEFARFILNIMLDKKSLFKIGDRQRFAWWSDEYQTIVIYDGNKNDCGTAFRPDEGIEYFHNEIK